MRGHFIRIIAGSIVGLFFLKLNYNHLKSAAIWLTIAAILLLGITLIVHLIHGSSPTARWLHIGPFRFQPSELAKFAFILYLASFYDRHADNLGDFKRGFIPPAATLLLIVLLIIAEPDFSTAAVIIVLSVTLMFIGGTKILHLAPFAGLLGIIAVITISLSPYKLKRIVTAIGGANDMQGAGYQIHQSLITLGNGGLWGRGLGGSVEKNLFLPEPHTDFVFSITGEEFGFIGATLLLILFLLLFIRALHISLRAPNVFGNLLGIGLSLSMFVYQLVNVGVVCGILPVTGLPLPFISYGGSTMLYNFACLGILLNISRHMINAREPIRLVTVHA
jgi:cell division protein FtsW